MNRLPDLAGPCSDFQRIALLSVQIFIHSFFFLLIMIVYNRTVLKVFGLPCSPCRADSFIKFEQWK